MSHKFESFKDALFYKTNCVFCNSELKMDEYYEDEYITFNISTSSNEAITLNKITEEVSYSKISKKIHFRNKYISCDNTFLTSLWVECKNCYKYSYRISLDFNLDAPSLEEVNLASEIFSFEENNLILELKLNYHSNCCDFISYDSDKTRTTTLPIIDVNYKNPQETLERVKKIVSFL